MIKLDELIKESCPSGVEYQKIGNAVEYEQPTKYIVTSTDYNDCEGISCFNCWSNIYSWIYK